MRLARPVGCVACRQALCPTPTWKAMHTLVTGVSTAQACLTRSSAATAEMRGKCWTCGQKTRKEQHFRSRTLANAQTPRIPRADDDWKACCSHLHFLKDGTFIWGKEFWVQPRSCLAWQRVTVSFFFGYFRKNGL